MTTPADNRISAVDGPARNTLRIAALRAAMAVGYDEGMPVRPTALIAEAAFYAVLELLEEWEQGGVAEPAEPGSGVTALRRHAPGE